MDLKQLVNFHFTNQILNHNGNTSLKYALLGFFGIQCIDIILGNLTKVGGIVKNGIELYMNNRLKKIENVQRYTSHIEFYRDYANTDESQTYVDAMIYHISQLNSVVKLQHRKIYIVNSKDEFEITKDIKGKVKHILEKDKVISEVVFSIYSYTLPLNKLREWSDNIFEVYKTELQTGFGKYKFYFNHKSSGANIPFDSQHLIFEMNKFATNKSLKNLFGEQIHIVNERIKLFQNDKEWYENKGIPYTFGLLLHGIPGCGKTSLIKAISKDTQRHILNIKLSSSVTLTQLRNLFYSDKIKVFTDVNTPLQYITIPIDQRIYVMEDVDCLTSILNNRESKQEEILSDEDVRTIKMLGKERWEQMKNLNTDKVSLSDILNIIDGVLETPGRILILTTNFPERLDSALLRPGRIDLIVNFKECNELQLKEMFQHFYDKKFNFNYKSIENVFTPAYIQEIFLRYIHNPDKAFEFLQHVYQKDTEASFQTMNMDVGVSKGVDNFITKTFKSFINNNESTNTESNILNDESIFVTDLSKSCTIVPKTSKTDINQLANSCIITDSEYAIKKSKKKPSTYSEPYYQDEDSKLLIQYKDGSVVDLDNKLFNDVVNNDELITGIETENMEDELYDSSFLTTKTWGRTAASSPVYSTYNNY